MTRQKYIKIKITQPEVHSPPCSYDSEAEKDTYEKWMQILRLKVS